MIIILPKDDTGQEEVDSLLLKKAYYVEGQVIEAGARVFIEENGISFFNLKDWPYYETKLLSTAVQYYLKGCNFKSLRFHKAKTGGGAGHVILDQKAMNQKVFRMNLSPTISIYTLLKVIAHESTHIRQIVRGHLAITNDGIRWKGKLVSQTTSKIGSQGYYDSPWEEEAYSQQDSQLIKFLSSRPFRALEKDFSQYLKKAYPDKGWTCTDILKAGTLHDGLMNRVTLISKR